MSPNQNKVSCYFFTIAFLCIDGSPIRCDINAPQTPIFSFEWMIIKLRITRALGKKENLLFKTFADSDVKFLEGSQKQRRIPDDHMPCFSSQATASLPVLKAGDIFLFFQSFSA